MEIILIIILFLLMLYAFIMLGKTKKESAAKDNRITALSQEISQLKNEISNHLSDKRSLNDKIQRLRAELSNLQIDKRQRMKRTVSLKIIMMP